MDNQIVGKAPHKSKAAGGEVKKSKYTEEQIAIAVKQTELCSQGYKIHIMFFAHIEKGFSTRQRLFAPTITQSRDCIA